MTNWADEWVCIYVCTCTRVHEDVYTYIYCTSFVLDMFNNNPTPGIVLLQHICVCVCVGVDIFYSS